MILLYTPTTSAEGAEVKQFYEDLQELSFSVYGVSCVSLLADSWLSLAALGLRCRPRASSGCGEQGSGFCRCGAQTLELGLRKCGAQALLPFGT